MSSKRGRREANAAGAIVIALGGSAFALSFFPTVEAWVNTVAWVVLGVVVAGAVAMVVRDVWL